MSTSTSPSTIPGVPAEKMPRHIAIIMDGNGRWARQRGLPRIEGHRQGAGSVRRVTEECARLGLEQLTLYCFSSENWKRSPEEIDFLMQLLQQYMVEQRSAIMEHNIRVLVIGRREGLPDNALREMDQTVAQSRGNAGLRLCLAINYGGRAELVDAFRRLAAQVQAGRLRPEDITEEAVAAHLYTAGMPEPDLLIRTADEMRVSNFLLWQISYAELWVTDRCWPDFGEAELRAAIASYAARDRRFGGR
jgi:undecaprenyl diphosphate synthase